MNWKKAISMMERGGLLQWVPTSIFLKQKYWRQTGHSLDLKNPRSFNEKLQWLKLYYAKDKELIAQYTALADKITAKDIVGSIIGEEHIIPTLGTWDKFDDIDFDVLPERFVLKTNHDSGGVVICSDKQKFDRRAARKKLEKSLRRNFYWFGREPQYKGIKPKIFAEQYMTDESGRELKDYKFFCFGGVAKCYKVDYNRFSSHRANYFTTDGELMKLGEKKCPPDFSKSNLAPANLQKMIEIAEQLSDGYSFLRTDFYDVNGKIYFGELTFFPASGFGEFIFEGNDELLGSWLKLPENSGGVLSNP